MGRKSIGLMFGFVVAVCLASPLTAGLAYAEDDIPGDKSLIADAPPAPPVPEGRVTRTPPIVFQSVDYQDVGSDSGKISVAGKAEPGSVLLLFFDQEPLGKLKAGDDGKWSFELKRRLDNGRHSFRAEHYDNKTGMLAGKAMVSLERARGDGDSAPPPSATP
jgi:hypothetical protein